jgi:hypothetical protein
MEAVEALLSRLPFQKLFSYDKQMDITLCDAHLNLPYASVFPPCWVAVLCIFSSLWLCE